MTSSENTLDERFLLMLIQRIAGTAISPSTVQNQGPPGTMDAAVRFLFRPEVISSFGGCNNSNAFSACLNLQTEDLQRKLPRVTKKDGSPRGGHWGTARKCLNIFLYECSLNRYLCERYDLKGLEPLLEVPLDSYVGKGLSEEDENQLPQYRLAWHTIIGLEPDVSNRYQQLAETVAKGMHMHRVHLDLHYLSYKDMTVSA